MINTEQANFAAMPISSDRF